MSNTLATFAVAGGSIPGAAATQLDGASGPATTSGAVMSLYIAKNAAGAIVATVSMQDQSLQDRSFTLSLVAADLAAVFTKLQSRGQALATSLAPGSTITFTATP